MLWMSKNKISDPYHMQASTSLCCDYTSRPTTTVSALNNRNGPIPDTHRDRTRIGRHEVRGGGLRGRSSAHPYGWYERVVRSRAGGGRSLKSPLRRESRAA